MVDHKDEGYKIPILVKENYESWFRQNKIKLRGKGVFYTCEKTLKDYTKVATVGEITKEFEELDITDVNTQKASKVRVNTDKRKKYEEDEATGLSFLFRSLNEDDQALIDEYESIFDFWAYLMKKYASTDAVTANKYITKIQMFTFEPGTSTITTLWDKLKDYRRKLVNANASMKDTYPDSALLLVLIRSLSKLFNSIVDTLNIQSTLLVEEKLKYLEEKETRLLEDTDEYAYAVFRGGKRLGLTDKYVLP